jgi:4'-phosphopantetheinyl transferase
MFETFNISENTQIGIINLSQFAITHQLEQKRDIELKGRESLVEYLLGTKAEIIYNEKGKPFIKNDSRHLSITHSHDKLAIIINKTEATGIDIELIRDKVLRIKHKFLSETELADANENITKLIVYWAVKESLYKVYGEKEVDFIKHLKVSAFDLSNKGKVFGNIDKHEIQSKFELEYQIIENYALAYCIKKIKS